MLKMPSDESAHSFILRHHMVYGIADVSNVVCKFGYWVKRPGVLRETLHLYQHYGERDLFRLAMNSSAVDHSRSIFGNPYRVLFELKDIFYSGRNSSQESGFHKIKFCSKCIVEQIKGIGFGYFKSNWLHQEFCAIHKQTLRTLDYPLKEPYDALQKVLSGRLSCKIQESKINNYHEELESIKLSVKAAPCLAEAFQGWIRKRFYLLDEKVAEECGVRCSRQILSWFLYDDGRFRTVNVRLLGVVLTAIRNLHSSKYCEFIQDNSDTIMVSCGVKSHGSISVPYLIHKDRDCQKCTEFRCSISPIIAVLCEHFSHKDTENLCDIQLKKTYQDEMAKFLFSIKA
ncbi:hypothetical protein V9656_001680 [Vibrio parahaemolyticus]